MMQKIIVWLVVTQDAGGGSRGHARQELGRDVDLLDRLVSWIPAARAGRVQGRPAHCPNATCYSLQDHGIDLSHIESRPSKVNGHAYDFFVSFTSTPDNEKACIAQLGSIAKITTVLDNNPDTENPTWFPRRLHELDIFATRVLGACEDLESDHPGACMLQV